MPMAVPLTMPSLPWPLSGPRAEHKADNRALAEKLDRLMGSLLAVKQS